MDRTVQISKTGHFNWICVALYYCYIIEKKTKGSNTTTQETKKYYYSYLFRSLVDSEFLSFSPDFSRKIPPHSREDTKIKFI